VLNGKISNIKNFCQWFPRARGLHYETAVKSGRQLRRERNERIRELHEHGMTQQQIADDVGISQRQVSNVLEIDCTQVQDISTPTQEERARGVR
jgi:DNA invertase Pin-like site-specific DNA recombinase